MISNILRSARANWHEIFLILFVFATRIPFQTHYLYTWDSVQFALALEKFDLATHQPHPPGYILYIALGKIAAALSADANAGFVAISILAAAVCGVLFYRLAKAFFRDTAFSFLFALALLSLPAVWFYGEVATAYIFDLLFSLAFALCAVRLYETSDKKYLGSFVFLYFLSGGIRQSLLVLFAPLFIFAIGVAITRRLCSRKDSVIGALLGLSAFGIWFVPLLSLAGGWGPYTHITDLLLLRSAQTTSIFAGAPWGATLSQLKLLAKILIAAGSSFFIFIAFAPLFLLHSRMRTTPSHHLWILALWIAPSLFVYGFLHLGQAGYVMTILGALVLLGGIAIVHIPHRNVLLVALIIFHAAFFLGASPTLTRSFQRVSWWYGFFTRTELAKSDSDIGGLVRHAQGVDPRSLVVITERGFRYREKPGAPWIKNTKEYMRHMSYYLPGVDVVELFWKEKKYFRIQNHSKLAFQYGDTIHVPQSVQSLMIVTNTIDYEEIERADLLPRDLPSGKRVYWKDFNDQPEVSYAGYTFVRGK